MGVKCSSAYNVSGKESRADSTRRTQEKKVEEKRFDCISLKRTRRPTGTRICIRMHTQTDRQTDTPLCSHVLEKIYATVGRSRGSALSSNEERSSRFMIPPMPKAGIIRQMRRSVEEMYVLRMLSDRSFSEKCGYI